MSFLLGKPVSPASLSYEDGKRQWFFSNQVNKYFEARFISQAAREIPEGFQWSRVWSLPSLGLTPPIPYLHPRPEEPREDLEGPLWVSCQLLALGVMAVAAELTAACAGPAAASALGRGVDRAVGTANAPEPWVASKLAKGCS